MEWVFYILGGITVLVVLFLIVACCAEPDCAVVGVFFILIGIVFAMFWFACGMDAKNERETVTNEYTAVVEIIQLECSSGNASATFYTTEHEGAVSIPLEYYTKLEIGDTITVKVVERTRHEQRVSIKYSFAEDVK